MLLTGATCAVNRRLEELKGQLDPLVGNATKEKIAAIYGIPLKRETIGTSEHWLYRFGYGHRSTYNQYTGVHTREQYDELQLVFDEEGILRRWRTLVQR
jgi:hypothetical protein